LETGFKPPADCLGHDRISRSILEKVAIMPPGSMIGIQGPWGRGKTDVLWRVADQSGAGKREVKGRNKAIWINPWQYGNPDLLTPIVIELLKQIKPAKKSSAKALRKAAVTIIKAGLSFGLKATALTVPGGQIYAAAANEAKELLEGLFEAEELDSESTPDPDPVSEMGKRFADLVGALLTEQGFAPNARLLICIDDLDRCLPHRQVALLEALHFLISAGAQVTILVALDPTLARQSVIVHYGTDMFDPERYLDKMFDLRITLPAVSGDVLKKLIKKQLACSVAFKGREITYSDLAAHCGSLFSNLEDSFNQAMFLPDLCNPRMIRRVLRRIELLARSGVSFDMNIEETDRWLLVLWLALVERRPELRAALRGAPALDEKAKCLENIRMAYSFDTHGYTEVEPWLPQGVPSPPKRRFTPPSASEVQAQKDSSMLVIGMPRRQDASDLVRVFDKLHDLSRQEEKSWTTLAKCFSTFDDILVKAGL